MIHTRRERMIQREERERERERERENETLLKSKQIKEGKNETE